MDQQTFDKFRDHDHDNKNFGQRIAKLEAKVESIEKRSAWWKNGVFKVAAGIFIGIVVGWILRHFLHEITNKRRGDPCGRPFKCY